MKKFLLKLLLFLLLIFLLPFCFVFIGDANNYFGQNKSGTSSEEPLAEMIEYAHNPVPNIILGDSRMHALKIEEFNQQTEETFAKMTGGGLSAREIIEMFWYCESFGDLEKVYLGVSFYNIQENYNGISNRIEKLRQTLKSPFSYVYSVNTIVDSYKYLTEEKADVDNSDVKQKKVVEYEKIDYIEYARNIYDACSLGRGYNIHQDSLDKLVEIAEYCRDNDIELIFVLPPYHHTIYEKVIKELDMEGEILRYQEVLVSCAEVRNMEYFDAFSFNDENFIDGFHLSQGALTKFIKTINKNDCDAMMRDKK